MESITIIPVFFGLSFCGYYVRAIWRIHNSSDGTAAEPSLADTWRKFRLSPKVIKGALHCSIASTGVFLGLEIAEDENQPDNSVSYSTEDDHY